MINSSDLPTLQSDNLPIGTSTSSTSIQTTWIIHIIPNRQVVVNVIETTTTISNLTWSFLTTAANLLLM